MNKLFVKAFLFWFILLILAIFNATIREVTYKPLLEPILGFWAHQLSAITGISLFFVAIYFFMNSIKEKYTKKDLLLMSGLWIFLTILFECWMNLFIRNLSIEQVLQTYYFWNGELWIFVLISLVIIPQFFFRVNK